MRSVLLLLFVFFYSLLSFAQTTVGYGFANRKGTEILTVNPDVGVLKGEDALTFRRAICDGGRLFEIAFAERQQSGPRDTMRAVAANFDQHEGYVFRIARGRTEPDGNCLLAPPSFFEQKELLPLAHSTNTSAPPACDAATVKALPALDERTPISCAVVAQSGTDIQLLAIEYQPVRGSLLGAIAIKRADKIALHAFPADKGDSSWRVDDGGKWEPASFQPLFVMRRSDGEYDVGLIWAGHEGASLHLLRSSGAQLSDRNIGYRYWLPK